MFWLVPFVHAAAPMATIGGLGSAHVVVLLVQRGEVATAVPCRDDGAGGDAAADGRWSCSPLPSAGAAEVGVAYDARFALAGQVEIGESLAVTVTGSGVTVGTDAGGVPGGPPGNAPPRALFLTRVTGLGSGPAPVLRLQAQGGSSELVCRDDGVFPDRGRNDGEHGCLGPAPASESAEVFLNGVEGGSSFGQVSWGPAVGLLQLEVDATAQIGRAHV